MPEYPYVGAFPAILSDLVHGDGVQVLRVTDGKREPVEADPGQTVELHPGDTLVTADPLPFAHAWLDGADGPDEAAPEAPQAAPKAKRAPKDEPPAGPPADPTA